MVETSMLIFLNLDKKLKFTLFANISILHIQVFTGMSTCKYLYLTRNNYVYNSVLKNCVEPFSRNFILTELCKGKTKHLGAFIIVTNDRIDI